MKRPTSRDRIPGTRPSNPGPKRKLAPARIKTSSPPRKNRKSARAWPAATPRTSKNHRTRTVIRPRSQPEGNNKPGQSDNQDSSATPNKNDRTQEGAEPKSRGAKQPGKSQQSDRANPQGSPPQDGSNDANDPTNEVKRADRSNNPRATEPDHEKRPAEGRSGKERAARPTTSPTNQAPIPKRTGQTRRRTKTGRAIARTSRAMRKSRIKARRRHLEKNADSSKDRKDWKR